MPRTTIVVMLDETPAGQKTNEHRVPVTKGSLLARELIRERVFSEIDRFNKSDQKVYHGLSEAIDSEITWGGTKHKERRTLDPEIELDAALDAFERRAFIMLVDDRTVKHLDEEILLQENSEVRFVKKTI